MKIASIAPLTYTPGKIETFQFIRGGIGADYHQNPQFYQYEDGKVILFWSAYDFDECSSNGVVLYCISNDHGQTWSDPQVFMADYLGGLSDFINILRIRGKQDTLMLHSRSRHHIEVDEKRRIASKGSNYFNSSTSLFLRRSTDGGYTFDHGEEIPWKLVSNGRELPGVGFYGSIDQVMQLKNGRILAVFMFLDPARIGDPNRPTQHYTGVCLYTDDEGLTWNRGKEITVDTPRGVMEIQMAEVESNSLFAIFRTKGGYLYQTRSYDGGITWSESIASPLPSPESMARLIKLQSGRLLVVWNNVSSITQQPRYPLTAAVSNDGGNTWSNPKIIENESGTNQLSNHGLIQLDDGRILLGISHYRNVRPMTSDLDVAIFDEKWLMNS